MLQLSNFILCCSLAFDPLCACSLALLIPSSWHPLCLSSCITPKLLTIFVLVLLHYSSAFDHLCAKVLLHCSSTIILPLFPPHQQLLSFSYSCHFTIIIVAILLLFILILLFPSSCCSSLLLVSLLFLNNIYFPPFDFLIIFLQQLFFSSYWSLTTAIPPLVHPK